MKPDDLVRALGNPRKDELAYDDFIAARSGQAWASIDRLEALAQLKHLADTGKMPSPDRRRGTNTHIHTNESFSIFRSPSEATWQGFQAGLDVLGINDHYTIGGHGEFREACRILGLRATFSMEAVAMDADLREAGVRCNDPGNAGRTYLSAKGIVRPLAEGSQGGSDLDMMKRALMDRNKQMVAKLNKLLAALEPKLQLTFGDVLLFTPRGNTTERHVCQALAELINRSIPDQALRTEYIGELAGGIEEGDLATDASYQNMLRARLLKSGKPAYVEESPEAFLSWERMIAMYREYGSIPSYPVLGNPVVEFEEDLDEMFSSIERLGLYAIEVIPHRNEHDRLAAILEAAEKHGHPVFNGTEHNTKTPMPLLDKWSGSDEFIGQLERGADVLIGHQVMASHAGMGYINGSGELSVPDRRRGLDLFGFVGRMAQTPEALAFLANLGAENARRLLAGLHEVAPSSAAWGIRARAEISPEQLSGVEVSEGKASFASPAAAETLKNWAEENIV